MTRSRSRSAIARALSLGAAATIGLLGLATPARASTVQQNVQYGSGSAEVMDVYQPAGTGPFPALAVVHGGGWIDGDKADTAFIAQDLAAHGYVAFDLNYCLAPSCHYPQNVQDVASAIAYVRAHAGEFHVDPDRIGGVGGSAGATLLDVAATQGSGPLDTGSRLAGVVSLSAATDLSQYFGSHAQQDFGGQGVSTDALRAASPVSQIDATDPPMMIVNGTQEMIPVSQAQELADAYQQAGVPHELNIVDQAGHAEHLWQYVSAQAYTFLDLHVKNFKGTVNTDASPGSQTTSPPPVTPSTKHHKRDRANQPASGGGSNAGVVAVAAGAGALALGGGTAWWLLRRRRPGV
jgi:acetyl esterase/lipase